MQLNIKNFKDVVIKGTMNFGIETLQLRFCDGKITSNMLSRTGTSISILNVENNVIDSNEELVWNFSEPATDLVPFLNLIKIETVDLSLVDIFMVLQDEIRKYKIPFCSENAVRRLGSDDIVNDQWFFEMQIDSNFIRNFENIKKIGARFGKVYFVVKQGKFFIETSDRTNIYTPEVGFELGDINKHDLSLAYKYTDIVNFFHCIEKDIDKNFILKVEYKEDQELGCIYAYSANDEEKYSLISRENL